MTNFNASHPKSEANLPPRIAWIYDGHLDKLDAATWLEPVQIMRESNWQVTLIAVGDPQQQHIKGVEITHIPMPDIYDYYPLSQTSFCNPSLLYLQIFEDNASF